MELHTKKKLIALAPLVLPAGFVLMFAIGEGFAEGFGHYIQLAPIVLFAVLAWYRPRIAGWLFLFFGIIMMCLFLYFSMARDTPGVANVAVVLIIFIPLMISGYLMLKLE